MNKKTLLSLILSLSLIICLQPPTAMAAPGNSSNTDNSLEALKDLKVDINEKIYNRTWNTTPFSPKYFTYTNEQLKAKWTQLMHGLKLPFPTLDFINYAKKHYPKGMKGVAPPLANNTAKYQAAWLDVARQFFAGNFQKAYKGGLKLGPLGMEMSAFAETIYANYLVKRQSVKYMMLQDVVNSFDNYRPMIDKMLKDPNPKIRANAAFAYVGYAYAMARIGEESPIPVILARGYAAKIKSAVKKALDVDPNLPLALAFRAGFDAGILRRVGKFTGRMTYGARKTVAVGDFKHALKLAPSQAIFQYEFANALIYMNHKRDLNEAMLHFEKAIRSRPYYAMEALDSMYAYKRLQEVRLYTLDYRSFREFDKDRREFIEVTDRNLHNVMAPNLTLDMLKHPEKYKLPAPD